MRLLGAHNDQSHGPHISSIVPYMGVLHRGEYLYWIVHTPKLLVGPRVTAALQANKPSDSPHQLGSSITYAAVWMTRSLKGATE
jgi:hypothetical protein